MLSAVPGVALGYLVLTGFLLGRVRPLPITFVPAPAGNTRGRFRERAAA